MLITEQNGVYETPEMKVVLLQVDNLLCQSTGTTSIRNWIDDDVLIDGTWE